MKDRDAFVEKLKAGIDSWNAEIDKLEARANAAQADMRSKYEAQIRELQAQRAEAEKKMKEARNASEAAWSEMSKGFEKAWHDIAEAFGKAANRTK